jgi:hypothetical protein
MVFGDLQSVRARLHAVERARRAGNRRELAALALEAQDALTWGVAKNLISVTEFERAKAYLQSVLGGRR